ncbi:MAG: radical SAM protein [Pseudomonadota bacterium]
MNFVAVILARSQSPTAPNRLLSRRPLAPIKGRPVLAWIKDRLAASRVLTEIVAAVGDRKQDRDIVRTAEGLGLRVLAGHPDRILHRLRQAAEASGADHIVRVNGNFPLVDPAALDVLAAAHLEKGADFSLNSHYHGLVYGLGVEIFSRQALERAVRERSSEEQKRLGALYLLHKPEKYRSFFLPASVTAPHLRVSVDFEADLVVVSKIIDDVPNPDNEKIISYLKSRPELAAWQEIGAPAEVSLEKVLLFPEKMKALRQNNHTALDLTYPISVELSLTNKCNHNCLWCSDAGLRRRQGKDMETALFKDLFRDLKEGGVRGVVLEGGGEPTIHPDFKKLVRLAKDQDLALGLISNGYFAPYLDALEDFEWIRISLDAAGRDQYRRLKGVDGFNRVINHLMTMAAQKRNRTLGVGYVVSNLNDDLLEIEQLVLFLRKIGVNYIQFRPVVDHPELFSAADPGFLKKYETREFSVNLSGMVDNIERGNSGLPCLAHSLSTVICADGGVFICGRLNQYETWEPLGNLNQESFNQIWTGPKRREQVGILYQPDFCRSNCPQCRMTKYNRLLSDVEKIKTRNFI